MKRGGFSLIEIVITITVLGILMALAVVAMNSSQVSSRDAERKADVEAISLAFENYYKNPVTFEGETISANFNGNTYPDFSTVANATYMNKIFADIDKKVFYAPGQSTDGTMNLYTAANNTQTTSGIAPQPTTDQYIYQPLTATGALCDDFFIRPPCTKFNIFYRLEKDNSVQMLTSRNQ